MSSELTNQLVIERYKFIQDKMKYLDNVLHVNISFLVKIFVSVFTLLIGSFLMHIKQPEILPINSLVVLTFFASILVFITSIIFLLMSISNIISWFGYRHDEVELLKAFGGSFQRNEPSLKKLFTWQESWIVFFLFLICILTSLSNIYANEVVSYLLFLVK